VAVRTDRDEVVKRRLNRVRKFTERDDMVRFSESLSYISIDFPECHLAHLTAIVISPLATFCQFAAALSCQVLLYDTPFDGSISF